MSNAQRPFIAPPDPPPAPHSPNHTGDEDSSSIDSAHFLIIAIVIIALFVLGFVLIFVSLQGAACPPLR